MTDTSVPPESQPTAWSVVLRAADPKDPHFRTAREQSLDGPCDGA